MVSTAKKLGAESSVPMSSLRFMARLLKIERIAKETLEPIAPPKLVHGKRELLKKTGWWSGAKRNKVDTFCELWEETRVSEQKKADENEADECEADENEAGDCDAT